MIRLTALCTRRLEVYPDYPGLPRITPDYPPKCTRITLYYNGFVGCINTTCRVLVAEAVADNMPHANYPK